tara:strand:+ start:422 stop:820 length:399 start_codon:yes stop_codon:yes gene_type:complete
MRALLLLLLLAPTAHAVPVVPNFSSGSMTSHTETTSKVTELIVSEDYATGWQYSVSGQNVQHSGSSMTPGTTTVDSWTGLNTGAKPNWTISTPGAAFQFVETYSGPGLSNKTTVQRTTEIESVTDTVSVFSQ